MLTTNRRRDTIILCPIPKSPSSPNLTYHAPSSPLHHKTQPARLLYKPQGSQPSYNTLLTNPNDLVLPYTAVASPGYELSHSWAEVSHNASRLPRIDPSLRLPRIDPSLIWQDSAHTTSLIACTEFCKSSSSANTLVAMNL